TGGELLEDAEHQLLLAHGRGVLDFKLFGKGYEFGWSLGLEFLEFHFPHGDVLNGNWASGSVGKKRRWRGREKVAGPRVRGHCGPSPDASGGSDPMEPELECIRLRSVGWRKDKKRPHHRQEAKRNLLKKRERSERFQHHQEHDQDHDRGRYLIDNSIESLRMPVIVGGKILDPAREQAVCRG